MELSDTRRGLHHESMVATSRAYEINLKNPISPGEMFAIAW